MGVWISSFKFGSITINRKKYEHDVTVTWQGKVKVAQLSTKHLFGEDEIMQLVFERPEIIIVGTGTDSCVKLAPEVSKFTDEKDIALMDMPTKHAIKEFNQLARAGEKVIAYIHVTC